MTSQPYDASRRVGESLVFTADLPAFAPIGQRYAEVEDARLDFAYSRDLMDHWTKYVDDVQHATADAIVGRRPWPEIVAEMSERYPKEFPLSLDGVPTSVMQKRETPEGQKYYLEWLAQNARFFLQSKSSGDNTAYAKQVRAERKKLLSPGTYNFDCGDRPDPTESQKALFERLQATQAEIFAEVAGALREFYALCRGHVFDLSDPYEQVLFPADDSGAVPLDRFRIQSFLLHPSHDEIGLTFDSMFGWCEEHRCAVLVSEGKVREGDWGGDDVLFSFYDEFSGADDDDA